MSDEFANNKEAEFGSDGVTDALSRRSAMRRLDGRSAQNRLNELIETIDSWDWRTASTAETGTLQISETTSTVPSGRTAEPVEAIQSQGLDRDPSQPSPATLLVPTSVRRTRADVEVPSQPVLEDEGTHELPLEIEERVSERHDAPQHQVQFETPSAPLTAATAVAVLERASSTEEIASPPADAQPQEAPTPAGAANPIRRLWLHRGTRVTILCLVAFAAVLLIIWGIRFAHRSPGSDGPSTTSGVQTSSSQNTTATTGTLTVTAAQLTQFKGYSDALQKAGTAATKAFVATGSTPTQAAIAGPVSAYATALNLYDFQLRFIQWPASMQSALTADHAQLEALVSYARSLAAISPSNMDNWLTGLHNRDSTTQQADNQVRVDLGLPAASSLP